MIAKIASKGQDVVLDNSHGGETALPVRRSNLVEHHIITLKAPRADKAVAGVAGNTPFTGYQVTGEYIKKLDGIKGRQIFEEMRRSDPQVQATTRAIVLPIRRCKYSVQPGGKTPKDKEIADIIKKGLFEEMSITWDDAIRHALLMFPFGFSILEKVWEERDGLIMPKKLDPRLPTSIWRWVFDRVKRNLVGPEQMDSDGQTYMLPIEKLLVFTNEREGDNWEGVSIYRPAYKPWYIKDQLEKINAIKHDRHGVGVPIAAVPANVKPDTQEWEDTVSSLESLYANEAGYIIQPEGYTYSILGAGDGGKAGTDVLPSIQYYDECIARSMLAMFINLGTTATGSRALGQSFVDVFLQAEQAYADYIADVINRYLIREWVGYNWGDVDMPKLVAAQIQPLDVPGLAEAAAKKLVTVDLALENVVRQSMNLPEIDEQTRKDNAPPPPVPFGQSGSATDPNADPGANPGQAKKPALDQAQQDVTVKKKLSDLGMRLGGPGSGRYPAGSGTWQDKLKSRIYKGGDVKDGDILFHGTTGHEFDEFHGQTAYLTGSPDEAQGFASNPLAAGHATQGDNPRVLVVTAKGGRTVDITGEVLDGMDAGMDPDQVISAMSAALSEQGARYVTFDHPSLVAGEQDFKVVVSLHPHEDLTVEGSGGSSADQIKKSWKMSIRLREPSPEEKLVDLTGMEYRLNLAQGTAANLLKQIRDVQAGDLAVQLVGGRAVQNLRVLQKKDMYDLLVGAFKASKKQGLSEIEQETRKQRPDLKFSVMRTARLADPRKRPLKSANAEQYATEGMSLGVEGQANKLATSMARWTLDLKQSGLQGDQLKVALLARYDDMSDADIDRMAAGAVNKGWGVGRLSGLEAVADETEYCYYSPMLDQRLCDNCLQTSLMPGAQSHQADDPDFATPNPACLGGDLCRCFTIAVMKAETAANQETQFGGPGSGRYPAGSGGQERLDDFSDRPLFDEGAESARYNNDQMAAVAAYNGSDSWVINAELRGQAEGLDQSRKDFVVQATTLIDESFASAPTLEAPALVERGGAFPQEQIDGFGYGDIIEDSGYLSTTYSPNVADEFATNSDTEMAATVFQIQVPQGTPYLHLSGPEGEDALGESEMLFPRNAKLLVLGKPSYDEHRMVNVVKAKLSYTRDFITGQGGK